MTRILLIGKNGQLGWELNRSLASLGELTVLDFPEIDLEQPDAVRAIIRRIGPGLIVNAAAYTAVDQAETDQQRAWKINAIAPGILAEEAKRLDALLVHYSTDYVFDGKKGAPYNEDDIPQPLNFYGSSKLEGEKLVLQSGANAFVLRTSWVYSLRQQGGFVAKVLQWARQNRTLRIVEDQVGNPTWARMLAEITGKFLSTGETTLRQQSGLYHVAGTGHASRFEWARAILDLDPNSASQKVKELLPARSIDFPSQAERPLFSALACEKFTSTFHVNIPDWRSSLQSALEAA